jgi:PRTRC genetic system protein E
MGAVFPLEGGRIMFQELMPLLAHRVVMLTATRINPNLVCVNIIPQRLKSGDENNEALTTPLSLTGTPRELDEELPKQLVEFVDSHLELSSTLKSAKEEMEAAAKAAREASKSTATKARVSTKESAPAKTNPGTASHIQTSEGQSIAASDDTGKDAAEAGTSSLPSDVPTSGDLFGNSGVEH